MKKASVFAGVAVYAALTSLFVLACSDIASPSQALTFENQADSAVTVRVNDRLVNMLRPGERKVFNTPRNYGNRHILAVDERGVARIDRTYTWDELQAVDFRIVIP
jgi:hypothetical protein